MAVGTAAAAKPPVGFVQTEAVSTSCSALAEDGVRIPIRNETAKRQKVRVAVVLLRPDGRQVRKKAVCGGVKPSPSLLRLRPGGGGAITLRAGNSQAKGTFSGSIAIFGRKGRVARRELQIAEVPAPSPALAIVPVVTSISAAIHTKDKGPFWVPVKGANNELPGLNKGSEGDELVPVGALTGPGGPVTVNYNGESKPLAPGISQIGLELEGDLSPGTYSGQVDLSPEDEEAGVLGLEIKVSSEVWLAIIALLGGIVLGVTLLRISGRTLPRARMLGRVAGLSRRHWVVTKALRAADSGSHPWSNLELKDLDELQGELEKRIEEATQRWKVVVQIDKTVVENLEAAIAVVEAQIDLLREVPQHARGLETALHQPRAVQLPGLRDTDSAQEKPKLDQEGEKLLTGERVKAGALKSTLEEMDNRGKQIRVLRGLEERLEELWKELPSPPEQEAKLRRLRGRLETCRHQLWIAEDGDVLGEAGEQLRSARGEWWDLKPEVEAARGQASPSPGLLGGIQGRICREGRPGAPAVQAEVQPPIAPTVSSPVVAAPAAPPPSSPPPPPPLTEDAANQAVWRAFLIQLFVVAVSALLALATGLEALYFGKTWGTLPDWLAAIVWGTAATAVTTGLVTSLDNLGALAALRGGKGR
ncbi:MAG TPA: hypothetical protein VFJ65_12515 [Solirubrobacterales bacterium]|nr:hypothetical protein [Solirubrobacterales bacterium]